MAVRVLVYECKHCGALKRTKHICERHEVCCLQNPEAKNCLLCEYLTQSGKSKTCGKTGVRCSVAVSATCEYFMRKQNG